MYRFAEVQRASSERGSVSELDEVLTVAEAAREVRSSDETIRAAVRAGKLRAFRLSDAPKARIRIPRAELDRFVNRDHERQVA
jgi:excisionase family DNA binding protein